MLLLRKPEQVFARRSIASLCLVMLLATQVCGQSSDREDALKAMRSAADFYRYQLATHGGYVYYYVPDRNERWGEGLAGDDEIWVQPPGTPTVGMAYLAAFRSSGDPFYLQAATEAGLALAYGQLNSGGWTNMIAFDPRNPRAADYRNGRRCRSLNPAGRNSTVMR